MNCNCSNYHKTVFQRGKDRCRGLTMGRYRSDNEEVSLTKEGLGGVIDQTGQSDKEHLVRNTIRSYPGCQGCDCITYVIYIQTLYMSSTYRPCTCHLHTNPVLYVIYIQTLYCMSSTCRPRTVCHLHTDPVLYVIYMQTPYCMSSI